MTLAELHKKLGDSVTLDNGYRRQRLVIVGTATMPSMGSGGPDDLEMGSGALVATSDFSVAALNVQEDPIPGPNAVLVRIRPGSNPSAAFGSLVQVNNAVNALPDDDQPAGGVISCYGRPRSSTTGRWEQFLPTSVWDWLWERSSPSVSTLAASVRRRRRDLAVLKVLGFTRRQIAGSIAWQSSTAVLVGTIVGIPLGIALGRFLWDSFVHEIDVIPVPSVPALWIALVAVGGLVLAKVVAAVPARIAAGAPTVALVRAE
jgi:hypothetical protein